MNHEGDCVGTAGWNWWFFHVGRAEGNDAQEAPPARAAEIDLIAITRSSRLQFLRRNINRSRPTLTQTLLSCYLNRGHVSSKVFDVAIFPKDAAETMRARNFLGWLEIPGSGDTRIASRRPLKEIFTKVDQECGVVVVPHPFTRNIRMLDGARKMSTKIDWLESGHVRLMQISEEKVSFIARMKGGNWINRYVLASATAAQRLSRSRPFNRSDAHKASENADGCSWFRPKPQ